MSDSFCIPATYRSSTMTVKLTRRQALAASLSALVPALLPRVVLAQPNNWPNRPVRIVVAFAPGGPVDILARRVAADLEAQFKMQFVVENVAGGGGRIGTRQVSQATGDGYTLLATSSAASASAPALFPEKELGYDAVKSFSQIALIGQGVVGFIVKSDSPWQSAADLAKAVKASSKPLFYATGGVGSLGHLAAAMAEQTLGLDMDHVAYRGSAPAQVDLLAGNIPLICDTLLPHMAQIRSGALRVISVFSPERLAILPNTPTFVEQGWPNLVASSWFGFCGSPGIPTDIVDRLNAAIGKYVAKQETKTWMLDQGITPDGTLSPGQYRDFVASEVERWTKVVKAGNIQVSA
ncbi:Bug family tripartite tricarboxylate transporter substrate binding protein [Bordetella genomosp. 13]|uniref:Bug family tripartite tricarboxylate transporter substrate binding protein n=1 Tax=Bordetella genomosp. 13 TaxID=463040 RepID=UPI0012F96CBF|nr:tripartite tricarboxylate transporter substrate binding protein [Bordetella genomosp. 13]